MRVQLTWSVEAAAFDALTEAVGAPLEACLTIRAGGKVIAGLHAQLSAHCAVPNARHLPAKRSRAALAPRVDAPSGGHPVHLLRDGVGERVVSFLEVDLDDTLPLPATRVLLVGDHQMINRALRYGKRQ